MKSFKYRIYPNVDQRDVLEKHFGCVRFVFNYYLRYRIDCYASTKKLINYHQTASELTRLKKQPEFVWLNEVNSQSLQASLRNLDTAYNNFFRKNAKFPRFKSKRNKQSFKVPQRFSLNGRLSVPGVNGIKIRQSRELEGKAISVTISKSASGKYFASFQCCVEIPAPRYTGNTIGIDFGLKDFITTSNGKKVKHPKQLRKSLKSLKQLQRRVSRKKKGSANRKKAIKRLACLYEMVANKRNDFLHKLSRQMVNENQMIILEDLSLKDMMNNHNFALSLSDSGWHEYVRQLEYKGQWYGCNIQKVDRFFPSSKRCHKCGWINEDLTLSDRRWTCLKCHTVHDREDNAAKNILLFNTEGHSEINACGVCVIPDSG